MALPIEVQQHRQPEVGNIITYVEQEADKCSLGKAYEVLSGRKVSETNMLLLLYYHSGRR